MIPFVIAACLTSDPSQCTLQVPQTLPSLAICQAQMERATVLWARDHRNLSITQAYCMPARPGQTR